MAETKTIQTTAPEPAVSQAGLADLGKIIADGIAAGIASTRPKKVSFGEYTRRQNEGRSKLKRPSTQNGQLCPEATLSNVEIDLLNRVRKPGRYFDRKVEVVFLEDSLGEPTSIDFRYSNTKDRANELRGYYTSFEDMLTKIVAVQDSEAAEDALHPRRRTA